MASWRRRSDVRETVREPGEVREKSIQFGSRFVRRILSHSAPVGGRDAMLFITFPRGSFPAGTVMGWPEVSGAR